MPSIRNWAQHPDKILDVLEGTKDEELGKILAWLYTKGDADLAMEVSQRIMDNVKQPNSRSSESLAHAMELVMDAYFVAQGDES